MIKWALLISIVFSLVSCTSSETVVEDNVEVQESNKYAGVKMITTKSYNAMVENDNVVPDSLIMLQSMEYFEDGREKQTTFFNLDGSISWIDIFEYDSNNKKVGSAFYQDGTELVSKYKYELDAQGRKCGFICINPENGSVLYDGISQYTPDGKIRHDGFLNKGKFEWNYAYHYDDNEEEIGYTFQDLETGNKYFTSYQFNEFDTNNFWTSKYVLEGDSVIVIEERVIERY